MRQGLAPRVPPPSDTFWMYRTARDAPYRPRSPGEAAAPARIDERMKSLHRPELYGWSTFDESRNVDFHGLCIVRPGGNVLVDPLPLSPHDRTHLDALGGARVIVITNSDHTRAAEALAAAYGAELVGPRAEAENFPFPCQRWAGEGDEIVPGLRCVELQGSKTPGELALVWQGSTLITGDLVRAHRAGALMVLPDGKLQNRAAALESVGRLAALPGIEAVLVGDGFQVYRDGAARLRELVASFG